MALAPLSQTIFLTEDGSAVASPKAVTIPPPIVTPAIDNIPSNSSLLPTEVSGAHDLYLAREAAMDDREQRILALENA